MRNIYVSAYARRRESSVWTVPIFIGLLDSRLRGNDEKRGRPGEFFAYLETTRTISKHLLE